METSEPGPVLRLPRYRVLQGGVPSYVVTDAGGTRVVASDREVWVGRPWVALRGRLLRRGAVIETLDDRVHDEGT